MNLPFMADFKFLFVFIIGLGRVLGYTDDLSGSCKVSRCGNNGPEIRLPFRLKNKQPKHCGYPGFEVSCDHMNRTILQLPVNVEFVVLNIDYLTQSMKVSDPYKCLPAKFPNLNFSASPFSPEYRDKEYYEDNKDFALFNCSPAERRSRFLIPVPCLSGREYKIYAYPLEHMLSGDLTSCFKFRNFSSVAFSFLYGSYQGFDYPQLDIPRLYWNVPYCRVCEQLGEWCTWNNTSIRQLDCLKPTETSKSSILHLTTAAKKRFFPVLAGVLFLLALIALYFICSSLKRLQEDQVKVQKFLKDYKTLKPSRYSFYDIKKITNNFKEKLGVGAYGTVFKGKLSKEIFVAVKVLQSSLENGEEFIKEVGTMATIHHANVVRLVGFCADGIKQALIYEFCPNESLEKFIYSENSERNFLGWERLHEIALGIARGIEYLHQGCDRQILHFDIKPHNILLDRNFNPKITDFGLAKLCPKDQSKISMTKARGTMGYIAPEVFSRDFGNVSYKSDVFSFGMLLLEMVGGRKNKDSTIQNNSRNYYPEIIYDRICRGDDIQEDSEIAKKIGIVGLLCIQWSPLDRPSMKTVIQMLEAKVEMLPMPANPFASIDGITKQARNYNTELDVISEEV